MGVLQSIPLCARGNSQVVEPLDLDKNNNEAAAVVISKPHKQVQVDAADSPEATSTPRPQSPTGLVNDQYSDSLAGSDSGSNPGEEPEPSTALSDSGLEESATEFEYTR